MVRVVPLLIAACAVPGADSASHAEARGPGATEWEWSDPDGTSTFDAAVFAADLQTVIDALPAYRPEPLLASYAAARDLGDDNCPAEDSLVTGGVTNTWWYGVCVSRQRVHFNGVMTAWGWEGVDVRDYAVTDLDGLAPEGFDWWGHGFEGRIDIYDEAATADFSGSCEAVTATGQASDGRLLNFDYVRGPAAWTGPEAAGSWLEATTVRAAVALWADSEPSGQGWTLHVNADQSGLGERYRSATLHYDMRLTADRLGCIAVQGFMLVRDSSTALWSEARVDQGESGACSACAEFEGETICSDLSPLIAEANARWW